jgi:hypothetical protein
VAAALGVVSAIAAPVASGAAQAATGDPCTFVIITAGPSLEISGTQVSGNRCSPLTQQSPPLDVVNQGLTCGSQLNFGLFLVLTSC